MVHPVHSSVIQTVRHNNGICSGLTDLIRRIARAIKNCFCCCFTSHDHTRERPSVVVVQEEPHHRRSFLNDGFIDWFARSVVPIRNTPRRQVEVHHTPGGGVNLSVRHHQPPPPLAVERELRHTLGGGANITLTPQRRI